MTATVTFPALILKSYETGNSSEILHTISADYGRLSVYARGLQSAKSRLRGVLQPLSLVELTVHLKDGSELATLRDAALLEDRSELATDLERFALSLVLAEAASVCCETAHPAPEIFAALLIALHDMDPRSHRAAPSAAIHGLHGILRASGHEPRIDESLLAPWTKGEKKPPCFFLELETATIHLQGRTPIRAIEWPAIPPRDAPQFLLPPAAVRTLYEAAKGKMAATLPAPEARQLLEAMIRLAEYQHGTPLRSADFWRGL